MSKKPTRAEFVRDSLLAELRAGKYVVGEKLPNEDELGSRFEVSRATVRDAVRGLMAIGYLSRKHGLGTFITGAPNHRHSIDLTVSYTAMIHHAGMQPGEVVVARQERPATQAESDRLGVEWHAPLVCIQRVRTADGVPAVYSDDRIPRALVAGVDEAAPNTSLYEFLARAGLKIHHAVAILRPVIADGKLSRLLQVPRGSALQFIDQIDFTADGTAAMLSREWHAPGVFELSVNRRALDPESCQ